MNAVILFGSPRKKGNTVELARVMAATLKEKGWSVRTLYLNDMNIRPCQGCYTCLPGGVCRINDDMKDVRKYIMESDLIVYATPIYWFGPSGQLKLAMDRSIAFMDESYNSRIEGKKAVTLTTFGDENMDTCRARHRNVPEDLRSFEGRLCGQGRRTRLPGRRGHRTGVQGQDKGPRRITGMNIRGPFYFTTKKTGKAIWDYKMLEEGDKVIVAVSGGKDSLCLLKIMQETAQVRPHQLRDHRLPRGHGFFLGQHGCPCGTF